MTFAEETAEESPVRRAPASRSVLKWIRVSHGLRDRDAVQRWIKTLNTLFASQGFERLDDITSAAVADYLHVLLSHSGRGDQIQHLNVLREDDGGYLSE